MSTLGFVPSAYEGDAQTLALFDEVPEGVGTAGMSLEEMVLEMRKVRESSNNEGETWNEPSD